MSALARQTPIGSAGRGRAGPRRYQAVPAVVLYIIVLWWAYAALIAPVWSYLGLTYARPPLLAVAVSFGLACLPVLFLPHTADRPSRWLVTFLYLGVYIPSCFLPVFQRHADGRSLRPHFVIVSAMLGVLVVLAAFDSLPRVRVAKPAIPPHIYWWGLLLAWVIGHGLVVFTFAGHLSLVSQATIEERRLAATGLVEGSAVTGYAITFGLFALNPLLIGVGLVRRKWLLLALGVAGELLIFAANAARASGAAIALIAMAVLLTRGDRRVRLVSVARVFASFVIAIILLHPFLGSSARLASDWVLYRTLMTSSASIDHYHEYFDTHPQVGLPHVVGLANPNIDGRHLGFAVGEWRTGNPSVQENANFIADGYAAQGLVGIAAASVVAGLLFMALDSLIGRRDRRIAIVVIAAQSVNIANLPLSTTTLGGGLALLAVLLWLLPQQASADAEVHTAEAPSSRGV